VLKKCVLGLPLVRPTTQNAPSEGNIVFKKSCLFIKIPDFTGGKGWL